MSRSWLDFADECDDDIDVCPCQSDVNYSMRPKASASTFQRVPGNSLVINRSCHFTNCQPVHDKRMLINSISAPQFDLADVLAHSN